MNVHTEHKQIYEIVRCDAFGWMARTHISGICMIGKPVIYLHIMHGNDDDEYVLFSNMSVGTF